MVDSDENRLNIVRFIAQEVVKDRKIPHFDKYAAGEIIREAQRRAGRKGKLTLRMRELGGLIRVSGDVAVQRGASLVTMDDVLTAKLTARGLEQQITDRYVESSKAYEMFRNTGSSVGMVNGLAVLGNSNMSELSGRVLPIVAEVSPSQSEKGGRIVATGKLGEIAKEAIENIAAVIKKHTLTSLSDNDINIQFIGTYDGVEGDSASCAITTAVLSAVENIPIDQTLAMTGSISVRGLVLPIGGVTAKIEGAAEAGMKRVLIPESNAKDVQIEAKYYDMVEIITTRNLRDVLEYAFVDCDRKAEYLEKLLPLTDNGESTAKVLARPPVYVRTEPEPESEPAPEPVAVPVPEEESVPAMPSVPAPQ
jgi:ATP-dependent Lon protease